MHNTDLLVVAHCGTFKPTVTQAKEKTLRIRVTAQVMENLKKLAAERGESVSLIGREAINSYLKDGRAHPKPRAA